MKLYDVYVYEDWTQSVEKIENGLEYEVRKTCECRWCGVELSISYKAPFASCNCYDQEWYYYPRRNGES